jgi:CheY-like chemotaxis protein
MAHLSCATLSGIKVLVVDDQPDVLYCVDSMLRKSGATVRTTTSPTEAFTLAQDDCPDVLISDYSMPGMDGCELLELMRRTFRSCIPKAAMISAFSSPRDRAAASQAGFAAYMVKPIDLQELTAIVAKLAGRND